MVSLVRSGTGADATISLLISVEEVIEKMREICPVCHAIDPAGIWLCGWRPPSHPCDATALWELFGSALPE